MAVVRDTEENLARCTCSGCPSYNRSMREGMEELFCARGRSDCEFEKNGCICGACPLAPQYKLEKMYYCDIGAAE